MLLNYIRYFSLFLLLCNIPGYLLVYFGPTLGTVSSYLSSISLLAYFILIKNWHKPLMPFVLMAILYYTLSGLNYSGTEPANFIKEFIRFMIMIICSVEVLHRSKVKDFFFILFLGALSVIINALLFPETNAIHGLVVGRFSGFYLNPNLAASICLIGFALSYSIPSKYWRYGGQFAFTLAGILTLSRTFILVWFIINVVAIKKSRKNLLVPVIGVLVLMLVFTFGNTKIFAADRFSALQSTFGNSTSKPRKVQGEGRAETWAYYYDLVYEKPLLGHGYQEFQIKGKNGPGAHNTFLMVIGEAGIIPFLIIVAIYGYLLIMAVQNFKVRPELLYITLVLTLSLMVGHGYFSNYFNALLSMFVYIELSKLKKTKNTIAEV